MKFLRSLISLYTEAYLLFITLRSARLSESLGEGIVINFELSDLLVLVGRHSYELALLEHVGAEG